MAASKIDKVCKLLEPEDIIGKIAPCFKTLLFDSQSFVRGSNEIRTNFLSLFNEFSCFGQLFVNCGPNDRQAKDGRIDFACVFQPFKGSGFGGQDQFTKETG
jgi:hypothetical protein